MNLLLTFALLPLMALDLMAQQGGFITGQVRDRSGAIIPSAEVRIQNEDTGARQKLLSDDSGRYISSELQPGLYKITVRHDGFRTLTRSDINVKPAAAAQADFNIELLPMQQEVTVTATQGDNDPMVSGVTVSRESAAAKLPLNGRDLHALFSLMPGATVTPASITSGGQFTVGGQRPNANSFRVDGVSGNVGIGIISVPGAFPGGTLPGMTTIGGMQSLASKEETERVELRSADFSAEFGDRPGAQIAIDTRSGTNDFHGSAFGYFRPHSLDSTDWFARGAAADLPTPSVNGWGGSLGGPIWKNRTFFFASFERTDVHDSALQLIPVASAAARTAAGAPYQALLDAFPQPAGLALSATEALGYSPLQKAAQVTNRSIRLDQSIGQHVQFFARYSSVPSNSTSIELGTAYSAFRWVSATGGLNIATGTIVQQARFNFSQASAKAEHGPADTPALNTLNQSLLNAFSNGLAVIPADWQVTQVSIAGTGQTVAGQSGASDQRQKTGAYSITRQAGKQELRAGADYTVLTPSYAQTSALAITSPGINALLAGIPLGLTNSIFEGPNLETKRWSFFAQDTFHLSDRLSVLAGVRWEFTPSAGGFGHGFNDFFYVGYWHGVGSDPVKVNPNLSGYNGSNWPMRYGQFAPRLGIAYHLKSPNVVLRAGTGLFYDTQMASIISNENPLNAWQYLPATANPIPAGSAVVNSSQPTLYLPRVWEWRTSIEKSIRENSLLSLSYFGSAGRKLLSNQATENQQTELLQTLAFTSHGASDYQALLVEFRGNFTPHFYSLVSYTWSHSIDNGSSDTAPLLVATANSNAYDRGSSSFDVRHVLNASLGYTFRGWNLSSTLFARAGFPFDVTTVDRSLGLGFDNNGRANLVSGEPIWMTNSAVPGGRELNPAAFQAPTTGQNGSLGRNVLTGPGVFQIDASLQRQFRLFKTLAAETSISAYNLLNHPAFANPVSYLGSALFGQSTSSANLMLGSGSPTTGLTPLYQAGGPRTLELSLRFSF
jgi:hypothetical protein